MQAREKRKDKASETLVNLHKLYEKRNKVRVGAYVVEWGELRLRVASLTSDLKSQTLELLAMH